VTQTKYESHTTDVIGIRTFHLEGGARDKDSIVLIHDGGFGADGTTTWDPALDLLAEDFHVYVPDLLGYGQTQKSYDFARGAASQRIDHVAKWTRTVGIEKAHFVGHCFGGGLVLTAAMSMRWPIRRAVSITGTGGLFRVPGAYEVAENYALDKDQMTTIVASLVSQPDVAEWNTEERYNRSLAPGHWSNLKAPTLQPPHQKARPPRGGDFLRSFGEIEVPVLLVAGSEDPMLLPGWQEELGDAIGANAETTVVVGARHGPQLDHPSEVVEIIKEFLSRE
jgi:pimeloyl-ACP methyl ester carboxylesterase